MDNPKAVKLKRALDCKSEIENLLLTHRNKVDVFVTISNEGSITGSYKLLDEDGKEDPAIRAKIKDLLDAYGCKIAVSVTIGTDGTYRGQYKVLAF